MAELATSLAEGKLGLQRLLSEFSTAIEKLQTEIFCLHGEFATLQIQYEAERRNAELSRVQLANAQFELQKLRLDDNTAAKIVSRYMWVPRSSVNV
jgi:hypothetical protein